MTVFQVGAVGLLAGRIREIYQIGAGLSLMRASLALLATARTTSAVVVLVELLSLGTSFVSPNLFAGGMLCNRPQRLPRANKFS
jgi:hypothetical protein